MPSVSVLIVSIKLALIGARREHGGTSKPNNDTYILSLLLPTIDADQINNIREVTHAI